MVVVKFTLTVVFVAPLRRACSVTVPLVSATVTALVVRFTALTSSSVMTTRFVPRPRVASLGLLNTRRKFSTLSCVSSFVIGTVKVLFVSPAAKLNVALVVV